jgi:hypothetical protein
MVFTEIIDKVDKKFSIPGIGVAGGIRLRNA